MTQTFHLRFHSTFLSVSNRDVFLLHQFKSFLLKNEGSITELLSLKKTTVLIVKLELQFLLVLAVMVSARAASYPFSPR